MNNILVKILSVVLLFLTITINCNSAERVKISTKYGDIILRLYDETPTHRDNFVKLVKEGFYDDLLFHRVIKEFMIQGGDPQSKDAEAGAMLGLGDVAYTLPAEFNHDLIHTQGALAAARLGDGVNPEKRSSGCQFYIVEGSAQTEQMLDYFEQMRQKRVAQNAFNKIISDNPTIKEQLATSQNNGDYPLFQQVKSQIDSIIKADYGKELEAVKYSQVQRQAYLQKGGSPNLDYDYTVFGEVEQGMEVIKKISEVETDSNNRPTEDIKMKIRILK